MNTRFSKTFTSSASCNDDVMKTNMAGFYPKCGKETKEGKVSGDVEMRRVMEVESDDRTVEMRAGGGGDVIRRRRCFWVFLNCGYHLQLHGLDDSNML
ncbi:hypothetical protein Tco_0694616 [Tanacetum coccineum]